MNLQSSLDALDGWNTAVLVDPRGRVQTKQQTPAMEYAGVWPIKWKYGKVGFFSNKKPNADAMLEEVGRALSTVRPALSFVHGSKVPLAEGAPPEVLKEFASCDLVVLASAECGGCTSWVCRDYISVEKLGVPCLLLATTRFENLARSVLAAGGIRAVHLALLQHPVSGIPAEQAQAKVRAVIGQVYEQVLGSANPIVTTEAKEPA